MSEEVKIKLERIRNLMDTEQLDNVLLTTTPNFFWLTGGKNGFVDKGSENAAVKLLIDRDNAYVICNSSERYRIMEEELSEKEFELIPFQWHEDEYEVLKPYLKGNRTGSDSGIYGSKNVMNQIQSQRYVLTPEEEKRMSEIGLECAQILETAVREIVPGETELEAAGRVTGQLISRGFQVPVCLVAADNRMLKYRHPIPTEKKIDKYAMIAICGQKYGLTISISRIISFGEIPDDIRKKYESLLKIDATYISNTVAGNKVCDILKKAYDVYSQEGYEADFHLHHQGGALGYLTRDYCVNFRNEEKVLNHQGFSWNPTISGVKLEDTYIVNGDKQTIVSDTNTWKYRNVEIDGKVIRRPDILIV